MDISIPVGRGSLLRYEDVPDDMTQAQRSVVVVAAINAVAWALYKKKPIVTDAGYGRPVVGAGVAAHKGKAWPRYSELATGYRNLISPFITKPDEPSIDAIFDVLMTPRPDDDPRITEWTRLTLGHELGSHPSGDCRECRLAADHQWRALMRVVDRNERTLQNFWAALVGGGWVGSPVATDETYRESAAQPPARRPHLQWPTDEPAF